MTAGASRLLPSARKFCFASRSWSTVPYTQDINRAFVAMREMDTGIFYVNAPTIGAEVHLPFGGTKQTGNGHREAGSAALDVFSKWIDLRGLQRQTAARAA